MKIELKFDVPISTNQAFDKKCQQVLQVAAQKAYEAAVERAPAAGQGPYSTGQMRQSIRVQQTGKFEYTLVCPVSYAIYNEFGTGPRGQATGAMPEFPNDPVISYHSGEVVVTRWGGHILSTPYIRRTQGMEAQPFMRPALLEGYKWLGKLMNKYLR